MHIPAPFREDDPDALFRLLQQHPLATLVGLAGQELIATPLPLLANRASGVLRGHMARPNEFWQRCDRERAVLAIFRGDDHYISPAWYPSKAEHGRVVPTWNYVEVHVTGRLTVHEGAGWLLPHLEELTAQQEQSMPEPWKPTDAPPEFLEASMKAIVGVEMSISSMEGKWKVSQNRVPRDREGAASGLEGLDTCPAQRMAELIRERLEQKASPKSNPPDNDFIQSEP